MYRKQTDDKLKGPRHGTLGNTGSDWRWFGFESFDLNEPSAAREESFKPVQGWICEINGVQDSPWVGLEQISGVRYNLNLKNSLIFECWSHYWSALLNLNLPVLVSTLSTCGNETLLPFVMLLNKKIIILQPQNQNMTTVAATRPPKKFLDLHQRMEK